jgi:hypothetical protein
VVTRPSLVLARAAVYGASIRAAAERAKVERENSSICFYNFATGACSATETKCFYQDLEVRFNSASRHRVTFAKDQTPPVDGFWSLTLYDAQHFFVPNEIKRFLARDQK